MVELGSTSSWTHTSLMRLLSLWLSYRHVATWSKPSSSALPPACFSSCASHLSEWHHHSVQVIIDIFLTLPHSQSAPSLWVLSPKQFLKMYLLSPHPTVTSLVHFTIFHLDSCNSFLNELLAFSLASLQWEYPEQSFSNQVWLWFIWTFCYCWQLSLLKKKYLNKPICLCVCVSY